MTLSLKTSFFLLLGVLILWFLYVERAILTPFILAGIFAYIFNPVVNFFYHKIRLPRTISIIIIYILLVSLIVVVGIFLSKRILNETFELKTYTDNLIITTQKEAANLPEWLSPSVEDFLLSLEKSKLLSPNQIANVFPQAISRIISVFIFLFSAFYFLKEGRHFVDKILSFFPSKYRIELEIVLQKMNMVFGAYLRGQLFLVFIVSLMLFICLSILGVRFALVLAIFSGFAEIVPIIGPITAGAIAAFVVFVTGNNNFGLSPLYAAGIAAGIYFVVRQFQDYFINPFVLGKVTNLHPLVIFFAVLAGGHLWGWMGMILAIPIAASIRILLEFLIGLVYKKSKKEEKKKTFKKS